MNLKADKTAGMCLVNLVIDQRLNVVSIDPGLDFGAFGNNAVMVPFSILEMLVWF